MAKRLALIHRLKVLGLPAPDHPLPLVTLEEFFSGNDDFGSIGCNLHPMLGPQRFFENLRDVRSKPTVQDVVVEVNEVEEADTTMWPFSDRVYILTSASRDELAVWLAELQPDTVEEIPADFQSTSLPHARPGLKWFSVWWD